MTRLMSESAFRKLAAEVYADQWGPGSQARPLSECCPRCTGQLLRDVESGVRACAAGCGYRSDA